MSEDVQVFKICDNEGSTVYLEHDENVMRILQGFVDWAEPKQKMIVEVVVVSREDLNKLPRSMI